MDASWVQKNALLRHLDLTIAFRPKGPRSRGDLRITNSGYDPILMQMIRMEALLEFLIAMFAEPAIRIVLLPFVLLFVTPFVLIIACFQEGPYWNEVYRCYGEVTAGWLAS